MFLFRSLLIYFAAHSASFAAFSFHDPQIPNDELTLYHAFEKGKVVPIERKITVENNCYRTEHTDTTGLKVISFVDRQSLKTVRVEKFRHDKPTLRVVCDSAGITVEDLQKNRKHRFNHSGPVFDRHTVWEVFRGFPFLDKKSIEFPLLVPELSVVTAVVSLEKQEIIDTDFGRVECYKLTMAPKGVIGWFYNKRFYFWFSCIPPHLLILYRDSDGRETKIQKPPQ
jgi:hypothetical protein